MVTEKMIEAAKAVIAQWDTPNWKIANPTSKFMDALRLAVDEAEKAILEPAWWVVTTDMGKVIFHGSDKDRADRVAAIHGRDAQALYTSPPALSTDAEPVAFKTPYFEKNINGKLVPIIVPVESASKPSPDWSWTPLYDRPQQPAPSGAVKDSPDGYACDQCGHVISHDAIVPNDVWEKISPSKDEGGTLCANCIVEKLDYAAALISDAHAVPALSAQVQDVARPIAEYHEDSGPVVWWKFPVEEPSYIGCPNSSDWPGYHTHWTPHPAIPAAPAAKLEEKP